ncbi:MAG: hypothetical protein ACK55Z_31580, partial [bacterium]
MRRHPDAPHRGPALSGGWPGIPGGQRPLAPAQLPGDAVRALRRCWAARSPASLRKHFDTGAFAVTGVGHGVDLKPGPGGAGFGSPTQQRPLDAPAFVGQANAGQRLVVRHQRPQHMHLATVVGDRGLLHALL